MQFMVIVFGTYLALFFNVSAYAQTKQHIADDLFVYIHTGPSSQYRIIGSIFAGEPIDVLQINAEASFTQILDSKGRKGWVQSKFVTGNLTRVQRISQLEQDLTAQTEKLKTLSQEDRLSSKLSEREAELEQLQNRYDALFLQNQALNDELSEIKINSNESLQRILIRYFIYGGGVLFFGIIFGLIIPNFTQNRRRRHTGGGWAN